MPSVRQIHRSVTNYDNSATFRVSKPVFQAFQLKPWAKDPEMKESLRSSLGIFGPGVQSEINRAKSVPVRSDKEGLAREDLRTAHSVATVRELISLKPKSSLEAMPVRPPLSRGKQIPGRYFPKPTAGESQKVVSFSMFRRYKAPVRSRSYGIGNSKSMDTSNLPIESNLFVDNLPRLERQSTPGFGSGRLHRPRRAPSDIKDIKSEVFAICFNTTGASSTKLPGEELHVIGSGDKPAPTASYDPTSELHSDYYTIKRVSVNSSSVSAQQTGKTSTLLHSKPSFSVVLRGQPKLLHPKLLLLQSEADARSELGERDTLSSHQADKKDGGQTDASMLDSVSKANQQEGGDAAPAQVTPVSTKIKVKIDGNASYDDEL